MLAPLILDLSAFYEILPAMIISVSCFVAALAATSLPETNKSYGFWSFNDSKYYIWYSYRFVQFRNGVEIFYFVNIYFDLNRLI